MDIKSYQFTKFIIRVIIVLEDDIMKTEERVIRFYVLCNKLKDIIRTGWKNWNVKRNRIESIAEHIYGTQMLAIAMKSEYSYDIDLEKVIYMLAIHELGETLIGDLTTFEISKEEKKKIEHDAVSKILKGLLDGKKIEELFLEFDNQKTDEAKFAYQCDKLDCCLQCKIYDEEGCVNLNNQNNISELENARVKELISQGLSWSEMWLRYWRDVYDDNFKAISDYALNNKIGDNNG